MFPALADNENEGSMNLWDSLILLCKLHALVCFKSCNCHNCNVLVAGKLCSQSAMVANIHHGRAAFKKYGTVSRSSSDILLTEPRLAGVWPCYTTCYLMTEGGAKIVKQCQFKTTNFFKVLKLNQL